MRRSDNTRLSSSSSSCATPTPISPAAAALSFFHAHRLPTTPSDPTDLPDTLDLHSDALAQHLRHRIRQRFAGQSPRHATSDEISTIVRQFIAEIDSGLAKNASSRSGVPSSRTLPRILNRQSNHHRPIRQANPPQESATGENGDRNAPLDGRRRRRNRPAREDFANGRATSTDADDIGGEHLISQMDALLSGSGSASVVAAHHVQELCSFNVWHDVRPRLVAMLSREGDVHRVALTLYSRLLALGMSEQRLFACYAFEDLCSALGAIGQFRERHEASVRIVAALTRILRDEGRTFFVKLPTHLIESMLRGFILATVANEESSYALEALALIDPGARWLEPLLRCLPLRDELLKVLVDVNLESVFDMHGQLFGENEFGDLQIDGTLESSNPSGSGRSLVALHQTAVALRICGCQEAINAVGVTLDKVALLIVQILHSAPHSSASLDILPIASALSNVKLCIDLCETESVANALIAPHGFLAQDSYPIDELRERIPTLLWHARLLNSIPKSAMNAIMGSAVVKMFHDATTVLLEMDNREMPSGFIELTRQHVIIIGATMSTLAISNNLINAMLRCRRRLVEQAEQVPTPTGSSAEHVLSAPLQEIAQLAQLILGTILSSCAHQLIDGGIDVALLEEAVLDCEAHCLNDVDAEQLLRRLVEFGCGSGAELLWRVGSVSRLVERVLSTDNDLHLDDVSDEERTLTLLDASRALLLHVPSPLPDSAAPILQRIAHSMSQSDSINALHLATSLCCVNALAAISLRSLLPEATDLNAPLDECAVLRRRLSQQLSCVFDCIPAAGASLQRNMTLDIGSIGECDDRLSSENWLIRRLFSEEDAQIGVVSQLARLWLGSGRRRQRCFCASPAHEAVGAEFVRLGLRNGLLVESSETALTHQLDAIVSDCRCLSEQFRLGSIFLLLGGDATDALRQSLERSGDDEHFSANSKRPLSAVIEEIANAELTRAERKRLHRLVLDGGDNVECNAGVIGERLVEQCFFGSSIVLDTSLTIALLVDICGVRAGVFALISLLREGRIRFGAEQLRSMERLDARHGHLFS